MGFRRIGLLLLLLVANPLSAAAQSAKPEKSIYYPDAVWQHRPPAEAVGERSPDELPERDAEKIGRERELRGAHRRAERRRGVGHRRHVEVRAEGRERDQDAEEERQPRRSFVLIQARIGF